ncbi:DUF4276 family protein [Bernardetia sp. OM2101]|uniref:DUF4276 family protein n=1 Tax=Bernardetia sp. OM2101 TaxID=3344876 RepID=UPI0035CFC56D
MKHLYIVVEGETELEFINQLVIPYFNSQNIYTHIQGIMIEKSGGGHGYDNIEHLKNTIEPLLYYKNEPIITTFIDHYGINSVRKLPNYEVCSQKQETEERIKCMEGNLFEIINSIKKYPFFIPNITRHEIETLFLSNPKEGFDLHLDKIKEEVIEMCNDFESVEDINHTLENAPSKRLERIYKNNNQKYAKVIDGIQIAELTGIEIILEKCPRFKNWLDKLIMELQKR